MSVYVESPGDSGKYLNMVRFTRLKDFGNTPGHFNRWSTNPLDLSFRTGNK